MATKSCPHQLPIVRMLTYSALSSEHSISGFETMKICPWMSGSVHLKGLRQLRTKRIVATVNTVDVKLTARRNVSIDWGASIIRA